MGSREANGDRRDSGELGRCLGAGESRQFRGQGQRHGHGYPMPGPEVIQPLDDEDVPIVDDLGNELDDVEDWPASSENYWQEVHEAHAVPVAHECAEHKHSMLLVGGLKTIAVTGCSGVPIPRGHGGAADLRIVTACRLLKLVPTHGNLTGHS